jgi:hypothetical protein
LPMAPATRSESRLMAPRVLFVGTGRDGTLSLASMMQEIVDRRGDGGRLAHEYGAREFYQAFCDFQETGEVRYADAIRRLIADCPFEYVIGNGYASVLPFFAEFGRTEVLVHLHRENRDACIRSLVRNCELFPAAYGYYSDSPAVTHKRMAAFHFGDMTRQSWERSSLGAKFGWYYDKTHSLIEAARDHFPRYLEIATERIDDISTRRMLAELMGASASDAPAPAHLNAHSFHMWDFPRERRAKMQWLLGRLNFFRLATDDAYGVDYFLEKFVAWTGYQVNGRMRELSPDDIRTREQSLATLDRAERTLREHLRNVESLREAIRQAPSAEA